MVGLHVAEDGANLITHTHCTKCHHESFNHFLILHLLLLTSLLDRYMCKLTNQALLLYNFFNLEFVEHNLCNR